MIYNKLLLETFFLSPSVSATAVWARVEPYSTHNTTLFALLLCFCIAAGIDCVSPLESVVLEATQVMYGAEVCTSSLTS